MSPEFPGAVFYVPDTGNANGIWTVGYDSTYYWTFYRWTGNAGDQRGGIRLLYTYPDEVSSISNVYFMCRTSSATATTSKCIVMHGNPALLSTNAAISQTSWGIETIDASGTAASVATDQERTLFVFDCYADDGAYVDIGPLWFSQA
jgi:hypothetical protein